MSDASVQRRLEATGQTPAIPILLLGLAALVVTADVRVINPLLRIIATEFGTDIGDTGVIVSAYAIPYGLFQLAYGPLGDRLGKLRVMTVAMFAFAAGTTACAVMGSLPALALMRFLTGVVAAAMIPLSLSYIGDTYPYAERQAAIGRFLAAIALGQVLSASLGGLVADYLSWRDIFLAFGLVSLPVAGWFWWVLRQHADQRPAAPPRFGVVAGYRNLLGRPAVRLVVGAVLLEGIFFHGSFAYFGAFLRDTLALDYVLIGVILSAFGVGNLLYSRLAGRLVRRFGEQGLLVLGGAVDCLCFIGVGFAPSAAVALVIVLVLGVGYYLLHSTLQTRATEMAPEARGTAVAIFAFSLFLGQGIGAALIGTLVDEIGYRPAFLGAGVALLLLGLGIVAIGSRLPARPAETSG